MHMAVCQSRHKKSAFSRDYFFRLKFFCSAFCHRKYPAFFHSNIHSCFDRFIICHYCYISDQQITFCHNHPPCHVFRFKEIARYLLNSACQFQNQGIPHTGSQKCSGHNQKTYQQNLRSLPDKSLQLTTNGKTRISPYHGKRRGKIDL